MPVGILSIASAGFHGHDAVGGHAVVVEAFRGDSLRGAAGHLLASFNMSRGCWRSTVVLFRRGLDECQDRVPDRLRQLGPCVHDAPQIGGLGVANVVSVGVSGDRVGFAVARRVASRCASVTCSVERGVGHRISNPTVPGSSPGGRVQRKVCVQHPLRQTRPRLQPWSCRLLWPFALVLR